MAELVVATEVEKRERDGFAHEAWGQKLSVEQFVAREERLRAHRWSRAKMTTWLWVEDRVLSSCESFDMLSFLDGKPGLTFGIASVFTERELRGRGHAARMMQAVAQRLGDHQAGILFSDVGDYYARFGWKTIPALERLFEPAPVESDVEFLIELPALEVPRTKFIVWPTADQLDWHRERERIYAELFGRAPLKFAGARTQDGVIAWAADFKNDKLLILHLQAREPGPLIAAAQRTAWDAGLKTVSCWDAMAPLAPGRPRTDSLPMVLPIAPGSESWSFVPRGIWI